MVSERHPTWHAAFPASPAPFGGLDCRRHSAQGLRADRSFSSPCVTYNKLNTYAYFKKRCYKLEDEKGYDPSNAKMAMERVQEWGDRIPLGVAYKDLQPTYEDSVAAFKNGPLVHQSMDIDKGVFQTLIDENM